MNMNEVVAVTDICKNYGVFSKKTYYKWKNRYDNNNG